MKKPDNEKKLLEHKKYIRMISIIPEIIADINILFSCLYDCRITIKIGVK